MKHPCKNCIVKVCCKNQCPEFDKFSTIVAKLTVISGITLSLILFIPLFYYMTNNGYAGVPVLMVWTSCMFFSRVIQFMVSKNSDIETQGRKDFFISFIFAPPILVTFILILILKPFVQAGVAQR